MATLAIRGHATRGKEIIEILEMLGGSNKHNYQADCDSLCFYIGKGVNIIYWDWVHNRYEDEDTLVFTLEEFLEKFPYKVGDKVIYTAGIGFISKVTWDNENDEMLYDVKVGNESWLTDAKHLQPYKEKNMEDNIIDTVKESDDRYRIVLNHQFDMEVDEGEYYAVRRKPQYPNTYEECFNICFGNKHHIVQVVGLDGLGDNKELFESFIKLKICRDAYRKMACDWKPDWTKADERKYCIANTEWNITKWVQKTTNKILAFPTEEMRDAFYENFKELIEECKELI